MNDFSYRPYTITDSEAITTSDRIKGHFADHQPDFLALDPDHDATFLANWETATTNALRCPTDETTVDLQQHANAQVAQRMDDCRKALNDLRYYADMAFGKVDMYAVFGFERNERTRHSPANHVVLMLSMHRMAQRLSTELMFQGMTPAQIQALQDTAMALLDAEANHEDHKRLRVMATVQRKLIFLRMWDFVQRVLRAAEVVFSDDGVKRGLFRV